MYLQSLYSLAEFSLSVETYVVMMKPDDGLIIAMAFFQ